jgi:rRNA processing protein Krr1/Pno1
VVNKIFKECLEALMDETERFDNIHQCRMTHTREVHKAVTTLVSTVGTEVTMDLTSCQVVIHPEKDLMAPT